MFTFAYFEDIVTAFFPQSFVIFLRNKKIFIPEFSGLNITTQV